MKLAALRLRGFQSYTSEQSVQLDPQLTVLAGQNNVGKTALLRSIRQMTDSTPGEAADFMVEYEWDLSAAEIRDALTREGHVLLEDHLAAMNGRVRASFASQAPALLDIDVDTGTDPRIGTHFLAHAEIVGTDLIARPGKHPGSGTRLWWYGPGFGNENVTVEGLQLFWQLINRLVSNAIYIQPRRTGSEPAQFVVTTVLRGDGSNLTTVIATLYNNSRLTTFRELERFICAAFTDVSRIDVTMGGGNPPTATVNLVYGDGDGQVVPLLHCGTGVEQMLMLATAVLTTSQAQVFLIDEPHAFLHPSAERHLLRFIKDHAQHQYVVATHSPVFLNTASLSQCRLITRTAQGSRVRDVSQLADVLEEVGVTAADLWSADGILWIEGPSDKKVGDALVAATVGLGDVTIRVVPMLDWIRSTASSAARAQATVEFCGAVQQAVLPIRVESLFVFDGDERAQELREQIMAATENRARFLGAREIENLFLRVSTIQPVLAAICTAANRPAPTLDQVGDDLDVLLNDLQNPKLYRVVLDGADATKVVGSRVLDALWWKWALATYDKVEDGPRLVARALADHPEDLQPFTDLVNELAGSIRGLRGGDHAQIVGAAIRN